MWIQQVIDLVKAHPIDPLVAAVGNRQGDGNCWKALGAVQESGALVADDGARSGRQNRSPEVLPAGSRRPGGDEDPGVDALPCSTTKSSTDRGSGETGGKSLSEGEGAGLSAGQ